MCGNRVCPIQTRLKRFLVLWLHFDFTVFIFIKVNKHVDIVLWIFSVVLETVSCLLMRHMGICMKFSVFLLCGSTTPFLISSFACVCQKCRLIKVWGATQGQLYKQNTIFFLSHRLLWSVKKVSDTAIEFHTNGSKQTSFCLSVYLLMPPTSVFSRL